MISANRFRDRIAAGQALAQHFLDRRIRKKTVVLALPRGGVPVAQQIAEALAVPMDVFMVRKVGPAGHSQIAIGAIATGGVQLIDDTLIAQAKIPTGVVSQMIANETAELKRREALYRGGTPALNLTHKSIILVDDGVATGYTMRVAILALRQLNPAHVTVAIPVGAPETCRVIAALVDELICPLQPSPFHAVGLWYDHFPAITDEEVREEIAEARRVAAAHERSEISR
jgi:predicted phosphoribosyltransferase